MLLPSELSLPRSRDSITAGGDVQAKVGEFVLDLDIREEAGPPFCPEAVGRVRTAMPRVSERRVCRVLAVAARDSRIDARVSWTSATRYAIASYRSRKVSFWKEGSGGSLLLAL